MESSTVPSTRASAPPVPSSGDKGLKKNAIGFVSSVVIGVASTAPGYSLAATLGFIAAAVALQSPAILLISFIPMFLVAAGYYYMNGACRAHERVALPSSGRLHRRLNVEGVN